jgi:hypothetical protein
MHATHGLQKYGLKLVTVHVKDEEVSCYYDISRLTKYLDKDSLVM